MVMNIWSKTGTIWILRGVASVVFGVFTLLRPGASVAALVLIFGAYALVDGAFLLGFAFRHDGPKAHYLVSGLLSLIAGAVTLLFPGLSAVALYFLIGVWAVSTGVAELALAFFLRASSLHVGALVFAGVLSVLCGVALLALPAAGVLALLSLITAYAIVNGVFLVGAGIRMRSFFRPAHAA
jgi:uncharacterized membrane protein HdeD (DUF308 family)